MGRNMQSAAPWLVGVGVPWSGIIRVHVEPDLEVWGHPHIVCSFFPLHPDYVRSSVVRGPDRKGVKAAQTLLKLFRHPLWYLYKAASHLYPSSNIVVASYATLAE